MTYNSYTEQELSQLGIQENELAIYTGTTNPRSSNTLSPNTNSKNAYDRWGKAVIYDLQKLRESLAQSLVGQCTAEILEILRLQGLTAETLLPDEQIREFAQQRKRPLISDKLREFLEIEDESGEQPLTSEKALIPEPPENFPE